MKDDSDATFVALYNAIPLATFIVDRTGTIVRANARSEVIFNYDLQSFSGISVRQLFSGLNDQIWEELLDTLPRENRIVLADWYAVRKGGETFRADTWVVLLNEDSWEIAVFVIVKE